jgi:hypothetical protein
MPMYPLISRLRYFVDIIVYATPVPDWTTQTGVYDGHLQFDLGWEELRMCPLHPPAVLYRGVSHISAISLGADIYGRHY